jgi:hypothetical protein
MLIGAVGFLDRVLGRTTPDEAGTRKLNACVVHAGGLLGVVGESYRQDELEMLSRRTTDASAFRDDLVDYAAEVADSDLTRPTDRAPLTSADEPPPGEVALHSFGGHMAEVMSRPFDDPAPAPLAHRE